MANGGAAVPLAATPPRRMRDEVKRATVVESLIEHSDRETPVHKAVQVGDVAVAVRIHEAASQAEAYAMYSDDARARGVAPASLKLFRSVLQETTHVKMGGTSPRVRRGVPSSHG